MNRVRERRKQLGIKQCQLAEAAQISQPYLHDLEMGNRGATEFTWQRIAKALECEVADIMEPKEDKQKT